MRHVSGLTLAVSLGALPVVAEAKEAARPPITGISHIAVYARDMAASDHFYGHILGGKKAPNPEDPTGARYYFGPHQFVEILPAPPTLGASMLAHVAYTTSDAAGLSKHFANGGIRASAVQRGENSSRWFAVKDPEGNEVRFVQSGTPAEPAPTAISGRIIHVGYLVRSRSAEDAFYRKVLGFRPYWYGAMKPDAIDWISQQVPDGTDWLEYMLSLIHI